MSLHATSAHRNSGRTVSQIPLFISRLVSHARAYTMLSIQPCLYGFNLAPSRSSKPAYTSLHPCARAGHSLHGNCVHPWASPLGQMTAPSRATRSHLFSLDTRATPREKSVATPNLGNITYPGGWPGLCQGLPLLLRVPRPFDFAQGRLFAGFEGRGFCTHPTRLCFPQPSHCDG
jgi:hypothetical protein